MWRMIEWAPRSHGRVCTRPREHSAGDVASPDGYLRRMVEKAGAGKLHLERSFYGRLRWAGGMTY